jgi:hypothetical protein
MISYLWEEDKLSVSATPCLNTHYRVINASHAIRQVETFDIERIPNNIVDTVMKSGHLLCASDTMDLTQ